MGENGSLNERDKERYDRQIMIQNFGEEGQRKLKSTTALVAGSGGLGSPAAIYLAAAGIGKIRLVDNDVIELSNLNRQVFYGDNDIGNRKVEVAGRKLNELNKDIEVETIDERITEDNISDFTKDCDLIVDCMDNYETRYILNRAAINEEIPLFHAAVEGMYGQATTIIPGETPCLRCIVPSSPPSEKFPVLGATPGLLATIQVHEVVKYIVGIGSLLKGKLLVVDEGIEFNEVNIKRNPDCPDCGGI